MHRLTSQLNRCLLFPSDAKLGVLIHRRVYSVLPHVFGVLIDNVQDNEVLLEVVIGLVNVHELVIHSNLAFEGSLANVTLEFAFVDVVDFVGHFLDNALQSQPRHQALGVNFVDVRALAEVLAERLALGLRGETNSTLGAFTVAHHALQSLSQHILRDLFRFLLLLVLEPRLVTSGIVDDFEYDMLLSYLENVSFDQHLCPELILFVFVLDESVKVTLL